MEMKSVDLSHYVLGFKSSARKEVAYETESAFWSLYRFGSVIFADRREPHV
jgi:hypothetical protein